jgi:hypothetical protein
LATGELAYPHEVPWPVEPEAACQESRTNTHKNGHFHSFFGGVNPEKKEKKKEKKKREKKGDISLAEHPAGIKLLQIVRVEEERHGGFVERQKLLKMLVKHPDLEFAVQAHFARRGGQLAREELQQRGLPGAVAANHCHPRVGVHAEPELAEERPTKR